MTLRVDPEEYRIESQTAVVGGTVTVPYHSIGISIHPLTPFDKSVAVSYLVPPDHDDQGNEFTINELSILADNDQTVGVPFYAAGTTVYSPLENETTSVYYLV